MKLDPIDLSMYRFVRQCYAAEQPGAVPVSFAHLWRCWARWVPTVFSDEKLITARLLLGDSRRLAQRFDCAGFFVDFKDEVVHVTQRPSANPKPGGQREARRVCCVDAIKAYVAANPGCSRQEAAEAIGNSYEYVSRLVRQLVAKRLVLDEGRAWGLRMPDAEPKKRGAA